MPATSFLIFGRLPQFRLEFRTTGRRCRGSGIQRYVVGLESIGELLHTSLQVLYIFVEIRLQLIVVEKVLRLALLLVLRQLIDCPNRGIPLLFGCLSLLFKRLQLAIQLEELAVIVLVIR